MAGDLVHYDQARRELAQCHKVDEAASIKDKAAKMAAYARMRDDEEMEAWLRDIQIRATQRIGELSAELAKAAGRPAKNLSGRTDKLNGKRAALKAAGISKSSAAEAEELAGGPEPNAQKAAKLALDGYLSDTKKNGAIPKLADARAAVKKAVAEALPTKPGKAKRPRPESTPEFETWRKLIGVVDALNGIDAPGNWAAVAKVPADLGLIADNLRDARRASRKLQSFINALEGG